MPRLLITGFGPFPRVPRNPSEQVARAAAANPRWRRLGWEVHLRILDTRYSALDEQMLPALSEINPDAVLLLGVAAKRDAITPERQARNRVSRLFPDAGGNVGDASLRLDRSDPRLIRRTHAPIDAMVRVMRRRRLRAAISHDAGRYLCNAAYYTALRACDPKARGRVVFVHVPFPRGIGQRAGTLHEMRRGNRATQKSAKQSTHRLSRRQASQQELKNAINDCIYLLITRRYSHKL